MLLKVCCPGQPSLHVGGKRNGAQKQKHPPCNRRDAGGGAEARLESQICMSFGHWEPCMHRFMRLNHGFLLCREEMQLPHLPGSPSSFPPSPTRPLHTSKGLLISSAPPGHLALTIPVKEQDTGLSCPSCLPGFRPVCTPVWPQELGGPRPSPSPPSRAGTRGQARVPAKPGW